MELKRGTKTNHKKGIAAQAKARKRQEAEARQARYDKLTIDQKLRQAKCGSKEHTKLLARKAAA